MSQMVHTFGACPSREPAALDAQHVHATNLSGYPINTYNTQADADPTYPKHPRPTAAPKV